MANNRSLRQTFLDLFRRGNDSQENVEQAQVEVVENSVSAKNCGIDPYIMNGSKFNIANIDVTFAVKNDDGEISEIAKITDIGSISKNESVYGLFLVLSEEKNKCSKVGIKVETGKLPCKWRLMSGHLLLDGVSGSDYKWFDVDGDIVIKSDMQLIISA
ncbi:MAG: hypothetical protein J6X18_06705 [Bacteroidales bacterium]|nr:hypothetical protein [Bacteroidales bacterium]